MNRNRLEIGMREADGFLGAAHARSANPDRPGIRKFVEAAGRT